MSLPQATAAAPLCPGDEGPQAPAAASADPVGDDWRQRLHQRLDQIIDDVLHRHASSSFLLFETTLLGLLASLGQLLLQQFLHARQQQLDLTAWLQQYRVADANAPRTLKTACGP